MSCYISTTHDAAAAAAGRPAEDGDCSNTGSILAARLEATQKVVFSMKEITLGLLANAYIRHMTAGFPKVHRQSGLRPFFWGGMR